MSVKAIYKCNPLLNVHCSGRNTETCGKECMHTLHKKYAKIEGDVNMFGIMERFNGQVKGIQEAGGLRYLVTAIQLDTGAVDVISNVDKLDEKAEYLNKTYDETGFHKFNPKIRIIDFMVG